MNNTFTFVLAGAVALALGVALQLSSRPGTAPPPQVPATGATAQPLNRLTLPDPQGQLQPLAQWRGKVRVVNFWATWCPPCVAEMPLLQAASEQFSSKGVEFIGIGIDSAMNIDEFAGNNGLSFTLLIGNSDTLELSGLFGNKAQGLPFTVIFDANDRLISTKLGPFSEPELAAALNAALQ